MYPLFVSVSPLFHFVVLREVLTLSFLQMRGLLGNIQSFVSLCSLALLLFLCTFFSILLVLHLMFGDIFSADFGPLVRSFSNVFHRNLQCSVLCTHFRRCYISFTNFCFLDDAPVYTCLLYTSPSPRDVEESRMPSSA